MTGRQPERKTDRNEEQYFEKQAISVSDRIFRGNVSYGSRAWSKQTAGALFQLIPDRMDDHYRNDHDRYGTWQPVWRKGS